MNEGMNHGCSARRETLALCVIAILCVTAGAQAGATFQGIGDLAGGIDFYSLGQGVSSDGSVVVGYSHGSNGTEATRWTAIGGLVGLADLPGGLDFYSI